MPTRRFRFVVPLLACLVLGASVPSLSACDSDPTGSGCCRVCRTGKPCGDTCIDRDQTCNTPAGCACAG